MEVDKLQNWLSSKMELPDEKEFASECLDLIQGIQCIRCELDDQIEWSHSEIVKATLIHVRSNIIGKYLKE